MDKEIYELDCMEMETNENCEIKNDFDQNFVSETDNENCEIKNVFDQNFVLEKGPLEKDHEMKKEIQEFIEEEPLDAWQEQFFQDTLNSRLNSQTISTENNTDNRVENARVDVKNQEVLEISAIDSQLKIIPRNSLVY